MYQFFADGELLHDINIKELKIYSPKIELEQNGIGSFEFTMYPTNPYIDKIQRMKSIMTVYQDGDMIFRGRMLETENATNNAVTFYCEDEYGFLCDSIQPPYEWNGSIEGLLQHFLDVHNAQADEIKRFKLGTVTVTDPNDYIVRSNSEYSSTWDAITKKLIEMLSGYLQIRHEEDGVYLDYLEDFDVLNAQQVTFGENMLSVKRTDNGADIATVLIPLGAEIEETGQRLTVADVNDGSIYVENAANIAKYGRIVKTVQWDDVTLPQNLLTKATAELANMGETVSSIEINAVDMANINKDISNFKMHAKIKVNSEFHGIDDYFLPLKMSIEPFNPSNNKITLNAEGYTLTGGEVDNDNRFDNIIETVEKIESDFNVNLPNIVDDAIQEVRQELSSIIEQMAESIRIEVSEKYYTKDGTDTLLEELSTQFEQTSNQFEFLFNSFTQDINDVINGTNAQFEDIRKYIRFVDGNIEIGQIGNEFSLLITKDKISFLQGVAEIAYLSNSKLYITDTHVLQMLRIGNFGFVPRSNGNLSFKKVV